MTSSDRKTIRQNRSENRNTLARIESLQVNINHDAKSRVCARSSARINVDYSLGFCTRSLGERMCPISELL